MLDNLVVSQAKLMKAQCKTNHKNGTSCGKCANYKFCGMYYPDTYLHDVELPKLTFYIYNEVKRDIIQILDNVYLGGK